VPGVGPATLDVALREGEAGRRCGLGNHHEQASNEAQVEWTSRGLDPASESGLACESEACASDLEGRGLANPDPEAEATDNGLQRQQLC